MLDLQQVQSFLAVVQAGSFVGAAESVGLSKAAVSRHVTDLESGLGVRLLHRTTRKVTLTEDGAQFHVRASELLAELERLESETISANIEASGLLRVNAPVTFGNLHLAPLWSRFLEQNPNVTLDVTLNDRVVDVVDEGYDCAIRITNLPSSQLVARKFAETRIVLCASPVYLAKHGVPVVPSELRDHQTISYTNWSGGNEWPFRGPSGAEPVRVVPRMQTNSGDTCVTAALNHDGIVLQPDFLVGPHLRSGALVELMPEYQVNTLGIHVVYASRRHLPMKTRRLIDFLVDAFRQFN